MPRKYVLLLVLSLSVIALDQWTKFLAVRELTSLFDRPRIGSVEPGSDSAGHHRRQAEGLPRGSAAAGRGWAALPAQADGDRLRGLLPLPLCRESRRRLQPLRGSSAARARTVLPPHQHRRGAADPPLLPQARRQGSHASLGPVGTAAGARRGGGQLHRPHRAWLRDRLPRGALDAPGLLARLQHRRQRDLSWVSGCCSWMASCARSRRPRRPRTPSPSRAPRPRPPDASRPLPLPLRDPARPGARSTRWRWRSWPSPAGAGGTGRSGPSTPSAACTRSRRRTTVSSARCSTWAWWAGCWWSACATRSPPGPSSARRARASRSTPTASCSRSASSPPCRWPVGCPSASGRRSEGPPPELFRWFETANAAIAAEQAAARAVQGTARLSALLQAREGRHGSRSPRASTWRGRRPATG